MLDAAVVPEGDRMRLPAEPDLEFLSRAVLAQIVQDRTTLLWCKPIDMGGEVAIDEQRLALRHRMRANDRVRRLREDLALVVAPHQHIGPAIDVIAGVRGGQSFEIDLHAGRQGVIRRRLAGEQGIAAAGRHRVEIEDAAERRLLVTGDIGMPVLAADALGVRIGMDGQDLGMPFRPRRVRVDVQFTEISAEPLVGFHVERLIAEKQHLVLRESLMQLLNLAVAKWLGQCDALDIGADARRNARDTDGSIAHGMTFDGGDADREGPIDTICWLHDGSNVTPYNPLTQRASCCRATTHSALSSQRWSISPAWRRTISPPCPTSRSLPR